MGASSIRTRATWCGVAAILLWSSLALMAVITADLPPFQVLATSFAVGGTLGVAMRAMRGREALRELRQPWPAFALATLALFGYHALYFIAFRRAPALEVNLINYLWPLLIVAFAAFLPGVRLRGGQIAGTLLGLAGVVLMLTRGRGVAFDTVHLTGYLAAFSAALIWAAYSVLNRRFHAVPSSAVAIACLAAALIAAVVHALAEDTHMPDATQWCVLVLMGVGPVGIAFGLWDQGTKHGDIALLGTLSYAAPLLSTLLLLLSGRVDAHASQAVAVVLLLVGAWFSMRASRAELPAQP